jgi:Asp-tRNA(Asn)/Glu-tRNA(Gln) amidotransferase C subunit
VTNNLPNNDLPDDDFKISEDKLREFLESSQKDFDYDNPVNNKVFGSDVRDQEIIDFIERINRIKTSVEAKNPTNTPDFDKLIDKVENLNAASREDVAELTDVFRMATEQMRLRAVDSAVINQLADLVTFHQDRIMSLMKQMSTLRIIVFALAGAVLMLGGFILTIIITVVK